MSQKVIKKETKKETSIDHVVSVNHHNYDEKSENSINMRNKNVISQKK